MRGKFKGQKGRFFFLEGGGVGAKGEDPNLSHEGRESIWKENLIHQGKAWKNCHAGYKKKTE